MALVLHLLKSFFPAIPSDQHRRRLRVSARDGLVYRLLFALGFSRCGRFPCSPLFGIVCLEARNSITLRNLPLSSFDDDDDDDNDDGGDDDDDENIIKHDHRIILVVGDSLFLDLN